MLCVSHCRLLATNLTTTTVVLLGLLFVYSLILFRFRHTAKTKYRNFETNIPRIGIFGSQSQISTFMRLWVIYIFLWSACLFCWRKYVDRSWVYIHVNRSQTHECGNWGWGRAIPRKGIHKWDFRCSAGRDCDWTDLCNCKKLRSMSTWSESQIIENCSSLFEVNNSFIARQRDKYDSFEFCILSIIGLKFYTFFGVLTGFKGVRKILYWGNNKYFFLKNVWKYTVFWAYAICIQYLQKVLIKYNPKNISCN